MKLLAASLALVLALGSVNSFAADVPAKESLSTPDNKALAVGDAAPEWKDLEGVDDEKHSLGDIKDAKAVVVVFTCNHCPVAQAYEDRIIQLAADYKDKGVEVVAINVNNIDADKLPAMKERAEAKGFEFDYLYDPSQEIGRAFGATVTPHAFLLDCEKKLVYVGAIDDNIDAAEVKENHLRDAIDSVVAGSKPAKESTKPAGCGIQYE